MRSSRQGRRTTRDSPQAVPVRPEVRQVRTPRGRAPRPARGAAAVVRPRRSGPPGVRRGPTTTRAAPRAQTVPVLTTVSRMRTPSSLSRLTPVGAAGVAVAAGGAAPAHAAVPPTAPTRRQRTQAARTVETVRTAPRTAARAGAARCRGNLVTPGRRLPRTSRTPRRTLRRPRSHAAAAARARVRSRAGRPVTR